MNAEGLKVPCIVDPTRVARIESEFTVRLNWEVFFFCDGDALARFLLDPVRWCGALTDPVTLRLAVVDHLNRSICMSSCRTASGRISSAARTVSSWLVNRAMSVFEGAKPTRTGSKVTSLTKMTVCRGAR